MARSMRNVVHSQPVSEDDTALNLGHAGLASECWSGTPGTRSNTRSNAMAAPQRPALRLRQSARPRMRHCPRPPYPAEARFTATDCQFLPE